MKFLKKLDKKILTSSANGAMPVARAALFVVFFWFGFLKVIYMSPAFGLVSALQDQTLPFLTNEAFIVILGIVEMVIGLSFLFPKLTRVAILLLVLHMITTFLPLVFLPDISWQAIMVPTLEGQYIIKNLVLLALAMQIGVQLKPMKKS